MAIHELNAKLVQIESHQSYTILRYQWGLGNRLHKSDRSGAVSSTKVQLSVKKREAVKLKESTENAKPRLKGHRLITRH